MKNYTYNLFPELMSKIDEAQQILTKFGLPPAQRNEISALTLLALCRIKESDSWNNAKRESLGLTKGVMAFVNENYKKTYAPNSREVFRRQVLHQFIQAGLVEYNPDDKSLSVNSPLAHYAITEEALNTIQKFGSHEWEKSANEYVKIAGSLFEKYSKERGELLVPITINEEIKLYLSPGAHNQVQKAIIEEFAPRFVKKAKVLYLGDTAKKDIHIDKKVLTELGIPIDQHSKLPDVVIFDEERNWLYLIEAVTSHGPVSPKRIVELEDFLKGCKTGKVYVTAFPDFIEFKKHTKDIAWETEVWVAEAPDHMIHFNGDRFLGPRK